MHLKKPKPTLNKQLVSLLSGLLAHGGYCTAETAALWLKTRFGKKALPVEAVLDELIEHDLIGQQEDSVYKLNSKGCRFLDQPKAGAGNRIHKPGIKERGLLRFKLAAGDKRFITDYAKIRAVLTTGVYSDLVLEDGVLVSVYVVKPMARIRTALLAAVSHITTPIRHRIYVRETAVESTKYLADQLKLAVDVVGHAEWSGISRADMN